MSKTKDWRLYENGKTYNNKLKPPYNDVVDTGWAFFNGDQWRNIDAENMPKPVFNIIKRVITFLVASLTSTKTKIHFEPLTGLEGMSELDDASIANAQVNNLLEKMKFDIKIKDLLFDAAITGDACLHFYYDMEHKPYGNIVPLSNGGSLEGVRGEICCEIVDGTNVYFGNANNPDPQKQPYIIISGRDMVENLQKEKDKYAKMQQEGEGSDLESIESDRNTFDMAGDSGKIEVDADSGGKALYIIVYRKGKVDKPILDELGQPKLDEMTGEPLTEEVETIFMSKSVEKSYIYENIDTGYKQFPVAWMNWEKKKNSYHGLGVASSVLPNQIFINRMFAMVMYHLMQTAFPKPVYNADYVNEWNNEIGSAIPIYATDIGANIKNIAGYLEPGNMSPQIVQVLEYAMTMTKDMLGINDTSLGNVTPDNTSAIIAVQKTAAIPLENPKANLYQFIEDVGHILFDMMGTNYGLRPLPIDITVPIQTGVDPMTGAPTMGEQTQRQVIPYDFNKLKDLWLNVRADVGESSFWSEVASNQTLTNLLSSGFIDPVQFLERSPDELIPKKEELVKEMKVRMEEQKALAAQQAVAAQQQQQQNPGGPPK